MRGAGGIDAGAAARPPERRGAPPGRAIALVVFNVVILFFLVNAAALVDLRVRTEGPFGELARTYGMSRVARAHPDLSAGDLAILRRESDRQRFEYEPFTEMRPLPAAGRLVSFVNAGYRPVRDQQPWPPSRDRAAVFVFGGSTTHGSFLPDAQTIPSYLQEVLRAAWKRPVAVYNFGRPSHFSTQERILFQQLLASGFRPDLAVFIDGLNEWRVIDGGGPYPWHGERSERLRRLVEERAETSVRGQIGAFARRLPLMRWLARRARPRAGPGEMPRGEEGMKNAADRWLANKEMTASGARALGVRTLFVWQPIPTYRYDLAYHLFPEAARTIRRAALGYPEMARRRDAGLLGPDLLWLADLQERRKENLYVDGAHYTAAFSRDIAGEIARAVTP